MDTQMNMDVGKDGSIDSPEAKEDSIRIIMDLLENNTGKTNAIAISDESEELKVIRESEEGKKQIDKLRKELMELSDKQYKAIEQEGCQ